MAEKRFDIVFSGKLVEGRSPQEVQSRFCSVMEMEQSQVQDIFNEGFGALICKDLEGSKAYACREELREAGVVCIVRECSSPVAESLSDELRSMDELRQLRPVQSKTQGARQRPHQSGSAQSESGIVSLIFKLILLAALVGGGWFGYQAYFPAP